MKMVFRCPECKKEFQSLLAGPVEEGYISFDENGYPDFSGMEPIHYNVRCSNKDCKFNEKVTESDLVYFFEENKVDMGE